MIPAILSLIKWREKIVNNPERIYNSWNFKLLGVVDIKIIMS